MSSLLRLLSVWQETEVRDSGEVKPLLGKDTLASDSGATDDTERNKTATTLTKDAGSQMYPPRETVLWHILITAAGAMWWYTYAALAIWNMETYQYRGFVWSPNLLRSAAAFIWISQVTCLGFVWFAAHARSLREAQMWNLITDLTCVPADGLVVLLDPTGNKATTVLGFAVATTFFGTMMVHYLREASLREDRLLGRDKDIPGPKHHVLPHGGEPGHDGIAIKSIFTTMLDYRPSKDFGSIYMGVRLSKAFVSFVVVLIATIEALDNTTGEDGTIHEASVTPEENPWLFASLASVLVHTSLEVIFITLLPGIDVHNHPNVLILHMCLYMVHMVAASIVAHESFFGDTIWDNLVNTWLFASGTVGLVHTSMAILEHIDMDERFGLKSTFA